MKTPCFSCRKEIEFEDGTLISRGEECPHCYANIRSCRMCRFYSEKSYNECAEPSADRIIDKEKANFCDFYQLTDSIRIDDASHTALNAAEALFKK